MTETDHKVTCYFFQTDNSGEKSPESFVFFDVCSNRVRMIKEQAAIDRRTKCSRTNRIKLQDALDKLVTDGVICKYTREDVPLGPERYLRHYDTVPEMEEAIRKKS